MSRTTLVILLFIIILLINWACCDRCFRINIRELPQYKLVKSKARSEQQVITEKIVEGVERCKELATSRKALAFNFGLGRRYHGTNSTRRMRHAKVCQILECPEILNFTTILRNKYYKYYSMYPGNISTEGETLICVPKAGLFVLVSKRSNYTEAGKFCRKFNGTLAHVASEERTTGLAKYVSHTVPSFVGLSNRDEERMWKNEFDEPLSCFEYRAWANGEPSHSRGCVTLTNPSDTTATFLWKVVPCNLELPFICEVSPMSRRIRNRQN